MGLFRSGTIPCVFALVCALCFAAAAYAGVATEVKLNKSVLLNLQQPSERVSIAAPAIAELVLISPTQLQINGTKIGSTSLIVWEKGGKTAFYDIHVKGDCSQLENQIKDIAPNDSITVDYANDTIVLGGKARNEQTIAKAMQLAQAYAAREANGLAQPTVLQYGYGIKEGPDQKGNNEIKVKVINQIEVDSPQQVLLEVKVAQVDKSALKSLGVSTLVKGRDGEGFTNLIGAPVGESTTSMTDGLVSTSTKGSGIAGNISGLGSFNPLDAFQAGVSWFNPGVGVVLKALATKNLAKVLAEPNLLVKSGQEGRFLAGSKIPVSVLSSTGGASVPSIYWIDVGVKLNFKPEVLEGGLISLRIEPAEVSSITGTLAVNGYPIIDTREVRTSVQLKDGESLILAGLLQEEAIKTMSKIPILGDIPILGALFRSTQDDIKEKELVFFITPKLVNPNPPGTKTELPTDKQLPPEQEKDLRWVPTL
ncbi:pilus assembly protein N-terminal domain-containing protein [Geotalea sp. SG265]|uniref:type II and III secretion system protein family protein n=1 Tax=Geotalea sp. SG265 TaxID=2922867 RepID=UPI001FAF7A89|nr:pilus assembly protein N-terminal domain-containing protein [Geotalea sp. SG265]